MRLLLPRDSKRQTAFNDLFYFIQNHRYFQDVKVLAELITWTKIGYNTVELTPEVRKYMIQYIPVNKGMLSTSLRRLREAGVIEGDKVIMINPHIYWRGTMLSRKELLKQQTHFRYLSPPTK